MAKEMRRLSVASEAGEAVCYHGEVLYVLGIEREHGRTLAYVSYLGETPKGQPASWAIVLHE